MTQRFFFTVSVEVNRTTGKFATRDDIAERIRDELEGSNPGTLDGLGADAESEYEIEMWEVEDK